jgi:hypothetical protein
MTSGVTQASRARKLIYLKFYVIFKRNADYEQIIAITTKNDS